MGYMLKTSQATLAVEVLHYGYPALSLLYFIFTSTLGFCTTPAASKKKDGKYDKRRALLSLMVLVAGTYVCSHFPVYTIGILTNLTGRQFCQYLDSYALRQALGRRAT